MRWDGMRNTETKVSKSKEQDVMVMGDGDLESGTKLEHKERTR